MSGTREICETCQEDLSALLDDELESERETEVRAHVTGCAACRARLAAFEALDGRLRSLPARAVPQDLEARLRARVAGEVRAVPQASRPARRRRRFVPVVVVTLLAAAAAVTLYLAVVRSPGSRARNLPVARQEIPPAQARPPEISPMPPSRIAERAPAPDRAPSPERAPIPQPPARLPTASSADLDAASDEELSVVLELQTLEDLEVIANLEVLEQLDTPGGNDQG